ncbi:hypothetical protein ACFWN1_20980 [Streptomyces sp. NPDC058459]
MECDGDQRRPPHHGGCRDPASASATAGTRVRLRDRYGAPARVWSLSGA